MPEIDVPSAAKRLGVHPSRVRALLVSGDLKGRKLGGRWFVDQYASDVRARSASVDGRAFSPSRAWGFLALLSGEEAPWLDPSALKDRRIAPPGVVAVDLMDSPDQRTRRAGIRVAERLRRDRSQAGR